MSERVSMRQVREVLRLKYECGCSYRQIELAVGLSKGSISAYLERATRAGMTWEVARELTDAEVEARLCRSLGVNEPSPRAPSDLGWVHGGMRRTGVRLQ